MTTYFHVAPAHYQTGDDLKCFDLLEEEGFTPEWKYDGEPIDTDVVCLFVTHAEALDFADNFLPNGKILRVAISDDDLIDELRMTQVSEGYPAIIRRIPGRCIEEVR